MNQDVATNIKKYTPAEILLSSNRNCESENIKTYNDTIKSNDDVIINNTNSKEKLKLSDILIGNKPKSLMTTLKIPPKRQTFFVTLNLNKNKNMSKTKPNFLPKPKINVKDSSHPFFKEVYSKLNTSKNANIIDTNNGKQPKNKFPKFDFSIIPYPERNSFNDKSYSLDDKEYFESLTSQFENLPFNLKASNKFNSFIDYTFSPLDFISLYTLFDQRNKPEKSNYPPFIVTCDLDKNFMDILKSKYNHLQSDPRFSKFFDLSYTLPLSSNNIDQWCDLYRPLKHSQCLQKSYFSKSIMEWISMAFLKLKKVDQSKRKQKLTKKKKITKELDPFIVYSDDDETDNDDYSTNVPLLIIEGPLGCGKTSIVHSIVESEFNGFVFEINSTQSRAKKDLLFHLKQIGTTSLIKQTPHYNDNSVILFDDVDLIDENNNDKDFWSGVTDLLSYSYRPVIFTTSDISIIPENIVSESTIYKFSSIPKKEVFQYLDIIALSRNLNIDDKILDKLSSTDLRRSLMNLQMFSYHCDKSNMGLMNVTVLDDDDDVYNKNEHSTDNILLELDNGISEIKKLKIHQLQIDINYYSHKIEQLNPFNYNDETTNDEICLETNLETVRNLSNACIQFYSSKYYSNGSRSKTCKYLNSDDYVKKNPVNSFNNLPIAKSLVEVDLFIKEMAVKESIRCENNNPRRFEDHPSDIFDDI